MRLSYVILTHNRREALLRTLRVLTDHTPLPADQWEAVVVDNASADGTAEAVRRAFPDVKLIRRNRNEGSPARNHGARVAEGEYLVLLDDDSYPCGDTVTQSMQYMDLHRRVGMVGGRVLLPDGSEDAAALPIVLPACAMCVRHDAFAAVGGFASDLFRQAEEYDLIFRMLAAGWDVKRLEHLTYRHDKVSASRSPALIQQLDIQNNLVLAARYLPRELRRQYRRDWLPRYAALARYSGHDQAVRIGLAQARAACIAEAHHGRHVLDAALIEVIFQLEHQARCVANWVNEHQLHRVVIADNTKNLYATWRACRLAEVDVLAISDNHPAYAGLAYRGVPIITEAQAASMPADGVVLSNINPARVDRRMEQLRSRFAGPILRLRQTAPSESRSPEQQHRWRRDEYPRMAV